MHISNYHRYTASTLLCRNTGIQFIDIVIFILIQNKQQQRRPGNSRRETKKYTVLESLCQCRIKEGG